MASKPPTFVSLPRADLASLDGARIVLFGASEASPYIAGQRSHSADAPAMLRNASAQFAGALNQYDFDTGLTLFPDKEEWRGCFDAGDVPTNAWDAEGNRARITEATRTILRAGAIPILLGGDDSVPIPFLAGFDEHGPITVLQIDAHVDWADVIQGNAYGYGSPMRRASEYSWVTNIVQVGMRGLGSGQKWQHDDARSWGAHLVSSYTLHESGPAAVLHPIEPDSRVVISIDCDGINPAILPAVNMPTPGGLTYEDLVTILRGVASKARIAGLVLAEYVPERDDRYQLSGLVAARIAAVALALARAQLPD